MATTVRPHTLGLGLSVGALVIAALSAKFGIAALALPLVVAAAIALLARPALAVAIAVSLVIIVEGSSSWGPSSLPSHVYDIVPGTKVAGHEVLLLLGTLAAVLERRARRLPILLPSPYGPAVGLLALGLLAGAWTGHEAGVGVNGLIVAGRNVVPVILVPFMVVQVVTDERRLRYALGLAAALCAFKAVAGLLAYVTGQTGFSDGGENLTYYEAPANIIMMFFTCFAAAAALTRVQLSRWVWLALPLVLASLALSLRRSFWIGTVLGLVLVLPIAVGSGRRFAIPAMAAIGVAIYLAVSTGGQLAAGSSGSDKSGSLRDRLSSISVSKIESNPQDRYRIGERRNVVAALRESPVAGLGLGIPYRQRYPLSLSDITHEYVHFAALWWWMKLGILGLLAYVALLATTVFAAARVWLRHPDAVVRAAGLAAATGIVGLGVAETTGTFAGPDPRSSVVVGAIAGLVSVAWKQSSGARRLAS